MTSNDGPGSFGRIIEDQYITAPISAGGDGITVYGSDGLVVIRRCVVDLGSWPLERLDEGLSGVDGARAVVRETRVARVGKGILWGNGDYPETDPGAELVLEDCTFADDCDLAFEYSSVQATISGNIRSVKNPRTGSITADRIGEIILDRNIKAPADCEIVEREKA